MSVSTAAAPPAEYPDSDGQPMADNTEQYEWIVTIKGNLDLLFRASPDVFVAGDHLIYAKQGDPSVRLAPDVYVALGRPKGHRGSYKVWEEAGVFPQVVFEVRSPGNRAAEMARKLLFYDQHGAEEYYDFDPGRNRLRGYVRADGQLDEVPDMNGFVSPRLGIRFDSTGPELVIRRPNGQRFLTFLELGERAEQADAEKARAETAEAELARLRARLRAAGLDPDATP